MFSNTLLNTDSILDPPVELTVLICEYKHSLWRINQVFDHVINYIESASPDELHKLIVNWEIPEPESVKEIRNSYWLAKGMAKVLNLTIESVFPKICKWDIQESLQRLIIKAMSSDVNDFAEQKVLEVKERLRGALINWKVNHIRLIRQEYAKKLLSI